VQNWPTLQERCGYPHDTWDSLGDRACLALANQLGLPAVSADRSWGKLQTGIPIELLR